MGRFGQRFGIGQGSVGSGSKSVQVKGFMLLSQPKPGKHRPAKPCGKAKVHNFFRDTEIFYACSRKSDRSFGDFGREKVNTRENKAIREEENADGQRDRKGAGRFLC